MSVLEACSVAQSAVTPARTPTRVPARVARGPLQGHEVPRLGSHQSVRNTVQNFATYEKLFHG